MSEISGAGAVPHVNSAWISTLADRAALPQTARAVPAAPAVAQTSASLLVAMQQSAERLALERDAAAHRTTRDTAVSQKPELGEPPAYHASTSVRGQANPGARLLQSMLELQALVNSSSIETIRSRLSALTARHEALKAQCERAGEQFGAALSTAEETARLAAQAQAVALASGNGPDLVAFDAAVARALEAERALLGAQASMSEVSVFQVPVLDVSKLQTNASRLTELMVVLQELLSKANTEAFRAQSEFLRETANARREAALREAVEVERQLRKQERLNRIFGWLGRVFGWVLAAISVVAAVFTGGASLIVAGVMLGLMATDQVVSATTGVSPLGEAVQAVISPLVEALAGAFEQMLLAFGVDTSTAKMIAQILASIVAVVTVIAATVVGVKVAGRLLGPLVSKLAGGFASGAPRAMPAALTRAAQQSSAALGRLGTHIRTRAFGDPANASVQGMRIAQAANIGYFGVGALTAGGQAAVGALQMKSSEASADFVLLDHSARVLQQMLDELLAVYAEGLRTLRGMMILSAEAFENEAETGRFIMRGIHGTV
jgi:invasin B